MFMSGWRRGEGLGKRTQSFEGNYIMSWDWGVDLFIMIFNASVCSLE
jgi:hypothetical protein